MSYTAGRVSVWNGVGWQQAIEPFWGMGLPTVTSYGTAINILYPGTAHTMSDWTEVIGSASAAQAFAIQFGCSVSGVNSATLLEFAKGSAGSETSIVAPFAVGSLDSATGTSRNSVFIPIQLQDGDRISARIQGARTSGTAFISFPISIETPNTSAATAIDVSPVSTATSRGVAMSASANVYVEVFASATNDYGAIAVIPSAGTSTIGINASAAVLTLATGAAGAEVDVLSTYFGVTTGEVVRFNRVFDINDNVGSFYAYGTGIITSVSALHRNNVQPIAIPQGTRLSAKVNTANTRIDLTILGIRP